MSVKHWLSHLCCLCVSVLVCGCGRAVPLAAPAVPVESLCSFGQEILTIPAEFADLYIDPHWYKDYALYSSYQIHSGPSEKGGRLWYESYGWVGRKVFSSFTLSAARRRPGWYFLFTLWQSKAFGQGNPYQGRNQQPPV